MNVLRCLAVLAVSTCCVYTFSIFLSKLAKKLGLIERASSSHGESAVDL